MFLDLKIVFFFDLFHKQGEAGYRGLEGNGGRDGARVSSNSGSLKEKNQYLVTIYVKMSSSVPLIQITFLLLFTRVLLDPVDLLDQLVLMVTRYKIYSVLFMYEC